MQVGSILKSNQPDTYEQLKKRNKHRQKKKRPKNEKVNFEKMMQDARVYRKVNRAYRQVK